MYGIYPIFLLILMRDKFAHSLDDYAYPLYVTSVQEGNEKTQDFFSVALKSTNITYSMTAHIDSRSSNFFKLNKETGSLSTIAEIDREFMSVHYFKIRATASVPSFTTSTMVQINVEDVNDNGPIFEQTFYNASVKESIKVGSSVLTVRANDADAGDNGRVSYFLESEDFRIDLDKGIVSTRRPLDREHAVQHKLTVLAKDNGSPPGSRRSAEVDLLISVVDENDNHPQFEKKIYYIDLKEDWDWRRNPIIGNITAYDADDRDNAAIKYTIIGGNNDNIFSANAENGNIRVQKNLDRESEDHYKLIVRAQDLGNPPKSNTTQVLIKLLDVNDNPPKFPSNDYYQSVAENVPKGYSVMQLTAFDPDLSINSRISYSLANVTSNYQNKYPPFVIDRETGWITTTNSLDRETSHSYRIFARAEDNGLPRLSSTATVNINVLDRNDNDPRFSQQKYEVRVSESAKLGTEIITLSAIDNDADSQLRYEVVGGNTRNRFSISTQQGRGIITVAQPLDFKFEKYFYLNINAIDSGGRFGSSVVTINVTDSNNHAPLFENTPYMADVFEDTPVGSTVLMLLATDQDFGENAKVSYTLEEYSDTFDVESESGALIVKRHLDRERVATYILSVLVEDHGIPDPLSDRTEIEISVLDINDNAPQFSSSEYRGSIYEDAAIGMSILDVVAIDKDFGDNAKIQYRFPLNDVYAGDDPSAFSIDPYSGVLRTKKKLDRETKEVFELIVEAFDAGIPEMSSTSSIIVTVLDVNDNPPKFKNDTLYFTLSENMPIGSRVGIVKAIDPDIGDNSDVVYHLLHSPDKKYFSMEENALDDSVVILSQKEFDYETDKTSYKLLLRAESSPLQSEISIVILITDQNDNLPDLKDFKIIFNHPNEFFSGVIGKVPATDKDPTSQLSYKFTYGNSANIVRLNESSGDIKLSPSFYSNVPIRAKIGVLVSDGRNEVRANLFLKVNYVSIEMLENSVTLRLKNISKLKFLTPYYTYLLETLSVIVPCTTQQIHVFSIKSDVDNILNVTFSISVAGVHEEIYLSPSLIKQRIFLQSDLATKLLILEQTPFDENLCVQEPCLNYEECHTVTRFGKQFDYISDDSIMFRSIEPITTYKCVCPKGYTGMTTRYTCDVPINMCYSSPCLNGAKCVSKENDYSCICAPNYVGKNCELSLLTSSCTDNQDLCKLPSRCVDLQKGGVTCQNCSRNYYHDQFCQLKSRSFSPGTYIAFNSIKARNSLNLTLEFASQSRRGLLFYNGRLNGEHDFMSISYEDAYLKFSFSLGDKNQELIVNRVKEGFSDGHFHQVELIIENEHITLSYDFCDKKLSLNHQSRLDSKLKCANRTIFQHSECNSYLGNCRKSFDLSGPLLLGGIPDGKDEKRIKTRSFSGCIKNVAIDQFELDMNSYVHDNGSVSGCPEKRNFCMSNPCKNGGICSEGWGSYQCKCHSDWDGKNCNHRVSKVYGFTSKRNSEITYKKDVHQIQIPWFNLLSFKTSSSNMDLLRVKIGKKEISELKVLNGFLFYSYMKTNVTIKSKRVDDGEWHNAQVKWMNSEVWLNLDYGQREITKNSHDYLNGKIVSQIITKNFEGCIRNVRVGNLMEKNSQLLFKKSIEPCSSGIFDYQSSNNCKLRDITTDVCLDVCKLGLCENRSKCKHISGNSGDYKCECSNPNKQYGRYCTQEKEQICPHHWWGSPVCGPCNCDPVKGFKESCNKNTGECSCKTFFYRDQEGSCKPCLCNSLGSTSRACDLSTGQCNCKSGIIGRRCDSCSHQFAELGRSGCHVVYGNCPAEIRNGISWRRTPIGSNTTAECPKDDSKGAAIRVCGKNGWEEPNTSQCIHDQFLKLKFTTTDFDNEPWKNIFMAYKVVETFPSNEDLYKKGSRNNFETHTITLKKEIEKENFEYAHMKERNFLSNLLRVISWLFKNPSWQYNDRLEVIELMRQYGRKIAQNMATTFTNPLEIISRNVIFGLDTDSTADKYIYIPKYNNYMKRPNAWNKVKATLSLSTESYQRNKRSLPNGIESEDKYIQYSEFNTTDLPELNRNKVSIHDLRWGTRIRHFSNIFTLQILYENVEESKSSLESIPTISYEGSLLYQHDRLYCAYLDNENRIWTSLDCESSISKPHEAEGDILSVVINCTCSSEGIFTVVEELVEKQNDYLENAYMSAIFLSLSLVAVLISVIVVIILFSFSYKNSISIHRNITLLFLFQQILIVLCVTFNASMIDYDILCKLVTMALHYFSITIFIWMLIDSVHIYRMLKELRDINHGKMSFYTTSGYGLPAVIIGLTVGVSGNNYGSASFCWLSFANLTTWSMFIPEIICTMVQVGFIFASLNAVFNIRGDIEDFSKLRRVFFINAGLLPLISATHIAAYILMNFRTPMFIFVYSGCALLTSIYLLLGFVFCDPLVCKPLRNCSCFNGKHQHNQVRQVHGPSPGAMDTMNLKDKKRRSHRQSASRTATLSKSALNYHHSYGYDDHQLGHHHHPKNYLEGDSVASTTSRSSNQFKESINSTDDDKLYSNMFHSNLSESDSDIERRSLDLASSHSSDEDNDPLDDEDKAPSSIYKKTLYVNDYPSTTPQQY
ncbi:LOW QUALITY PROTEIN: protocadherin-like wing polarity protein stan [Lepeophtheirus salmonis]|uniref:LOW QUALITY PROTEIN: protocadherin-like wing polarity protein stan n=1 Tax=Lepeophtheirus salmonis TaxID=72036 RepID=UPI003AF3C542